MVHVTVVGKFKGGRMVMLPGHSNGARKVA